MNLSIGDVIAIVSAIGSVVLLVMRLERRMTKLETTIRLRVLRKKSDDTEFYEKE